MSGANITIAIPLYKAARFAGTVAGNLIRLRGPVRLLVSDADEQDDTLQRLRRAFASRDDIEWLGARSLHEGWVPHCNDLLVRARTPLFMWLPQDDEIDLNWPLGGSAALAKAPGAVLACGSIVGQDDSGQPLPLRISPGEPFASCDLGVRLSAIGRAFEMDQSALGIWFRGVMRRDHAIPLPANDEWADIFWASAMLVRGPMVPIPNALYRKAWYRGNTHASWQPIRGADGYAVDALESLVRAVLPRLAAEQREEALATVWRAADAARREHQRASISELTQLLEAERAGNATLTGLLEAERSALSAMRGSWSWRITRPLRTAKRLLAIPRRG